MRVVEVRGGPPKSPQCWGDFRRAADRRRGGWGGVGPLNPRHPLRGYPVGDFTRVVLAAWWVVMVVPPGFGQRRGLGGAAWGRVTDEERCCYLYGPVEGGKV